MLETCRNQQLQDRGTGRSCTGHDDPYLLDLLADHAQRIGERGEHDDRGAVLVIMEDGDVEGLTQPRLDLETARGGDVLKVDAGEAGGDCLDDGDDFIAVLSVETDRPRVDPGETL